MRRQLWWLVAAVPAVGVLGVVAIVAFRAQHALDRAAVSVAHEGRFAAEVRPLAPESNPGFEAIATPTRFTCGAVYRGRIFVGGPSGISVYRFGLDGLTLEKRYHAGMELPAATVTSMVVGQLRGSADAELMAGTAGAGILLYAEPDAEQENGSFRQVWTKDADARDVTALLPMATGDLLVGTHHRGLLVFHGLNDGAAGHGPNSRTDDGGGDDAALEVFHPSLSGLDITALAGDATGVWVGTRNHGARRWHAGEIDSFEAAASASGGGALPDEQVNAIAIDGDRAFAGTPLGVEEFDNGRPARVLAQNSYANALAAEDGSITVGSLEDGIRRIELNPSQRRGPGGSAGFAEESEHNSAADAAEQFLTVRGDSATRLYAVMASRILERQSSGGWSPVFMSADTTDSGAEAKHAATLTDGNISALAFAPDGRLWVGYFDRGLDVLSEDHARIEHHEDDRLFCINRIVTDPRRNTMDVATANGLVLLDAQGRPRQVLTRRDGLIADHVTDVAFSAGSMVLATPAGLTFMDGLGARSLYAFEGLVNNHVYALGTRDSGREVLAGTLGGISLLDEEQVRRNMTVANSGLKHNWVTAIVPASRNTWMVGTYGAGVMLLDADGHFSPMEGVTRNMVVNPNAMLATGAHIFVGTLSDGLWVYSRASGRWSRVTAGLPSVNVTALAERNGELYVGTENGLVRIAERLLE
jgi:ligand-binding sensor domain-containing protein